MSHFEKRHLYLPERDRSFWKCDAALDVSLLYLAWGYRDFHRHPIPVSCHEGWVGVLIEEGCPTIAVNKQSVRMPAGTLALIGPNCSFGWNDSATGPCKFLLWMWRNFGGTSFALGLQAAYVTRLLSRKDRKPFVLLHDLCRREVLHSTAPCRSYLKGCHIIFEATMQRAIQKHPDKKQLASELGELAKAWMSAHFESKEPIARLCDYLNRSQATLYRLFMNEFGMSPLACFHQLRMEKANELLTTSNRSVKEIACQLGYEYFNDLSRAYRKEFGRSPTEARQATRTTYSATH